MNSRIPIRIHSIDRMRGFAALLVLCQHVFERFSPTFSHLSLHYLNFGIVGVVLFFLISGQIIAISAKNKSSLEFLINRFFRIFPLYWVVMLLGMLITIIQGNTFSWFTAVINTALIQNYTGFASFVGGSWTLPLELVFYTLFITFTRSKFLENKSPITFFLILSMFLLLSLRYLGYIAIPLGRMLLIHTAFQSSLWQQSNPVKSKINFALLIGMIIYYVSLNENLLFSSTCIGFSWLTAYLLFFIMQGERPKFESSKAGTAAAGFNQVSDAGGLKDNGYLTQSMFESRAMHFLINISSWMGKVSYSVYLLQGLVIECTKSALKYFPSATNTIYLLVIPFTYLLAPLFYAWVEQPCVALGKLVYRKKFWRSPQFSE